MPLAVPHARAPARLPLRRTAAPSLQAAPLHSRFERKRANVVVNSAAGVPAAPAAKPFKWGADMKSLGICVAVGTAMWMMPPPAGVALKAWHLLAIFTGARGAPRARNFLAYGTIAAISRPSRR